MKKILLITFALGLASTLALAQGTINFGSTSPNHKILWGGNPVGAGYSAALYWGALGSLEGALIQLGSTASVQAGTGFILGGTRTTGVATAEGANATFQIRAWNGTATTWEAALVGGGTTAAGKSALFENPTGAPSASPPTPPALLTGWITPVETYFPEPSTFAIFGLGLGVLAMSSRRQPRRG